MSPPDKLIDEAAMKVITDGLVDPWHRTFARDIVTIYLEHANKHPFPDGLRGIASYLPPLDDESTVII